MPHAVLSLVGHFLITLFLVLSFSLFVLIFPRYSLEATSHLFSSGRSGLVSLEVLLQNFWQKISSTFRTIDNMFIPHFAKRNKSMD